MKRIDLKLPVKAPLAVLLGFGLAAQVFLNTLTLNKLAHYPPVVTVDPDTLMAELVSANRDRKALLDLFRGGFLAAAALATGSYPYEMPEEGAARVDPKILRQFFSPAAAEIVRQLRHRVAVYRPYGTVALSYNSFDPKRLKIRERKGAFVFEAFFVQTVPEDGFERTRTFHVRAMANLTPATFANPYNLKFTAFSLSEIEPKKPKD